MESSVNRMTVEIWSDIMCPFCYLGKRKFEKALSQFPEQEKVEVVWKSFMLQPNLVTDTSISIHKYLSQIKGVDIDRAKQMNAHVGESAKLFGLDYNYDKMVVANTLKAHILLHVAKKQGKQNEVKERLLKAYFTEGRNIDDVQTLIGIGKEAGLNVEGVANLFEDQKYIDEVREDIYEAQQLGIRGVPFFVFNRKYGVSGAQEPVVFTETIQKAFDEWGKTNLLPLGEVANGQTCTPDGVCG
jgi:predicted DsbA family dithiol-disulfide isomerase